MAIKPNRAAGVKEIVAQKRMGSGFAKAIAAGSCPLARRRDLPRAAIAPRMPGMFARYTALGLALALLAAACSHAPAPLELQAIGLDPANATQGGGTCTTRLQLLNIGPEDLHLVQLLVQNESSGDLLQSLDPAALQTLFGSIFLAVGGELNGDLSLSPPSPLAAGESFSFFLSLVTVDLQGNTVLYNATFGCAG
jgi:hypothetical protein